MGEDWIAAYKDHVKKSLVQEDLYLLIIDKMQITLIQAYEEVNRLETFKGHAELLLPSCQYEQIEKATKHYLLQAKIVN